MQRVHFIAIGGTGMGSLAGLLKARGWEVSGSDKALYPPMSTALEQWGIPVTLGFDPDNVLSAKPDLVVIGNAVGPDNPEARAAIDAGLPYKSFSDALYELAMVGKHSVVVAGTHGKTSVTSLLSFLLEQTGQDPSFLVGGIIPYFGGSFREGEGAHFVVEGDEYDTAFFDKTPKFIHYHPETLLLTSVEFDHADIYRDLDHVKESFRMLVDEMPQHGAILAAVDYEHVRDVLTGGRAQVIGYGVSGNGPANWRARDIETTAQGTHFKLMHGGRFVASVDSPLFGLHNVENVVGALAALDSLGVSIKDAVEALPRFSGVKRRMEVRGEERGLTVLDDFAHHPTAVRETLTATIAAYPNRRVIAVFEPRSNTSRRAVFQKDYVDAFTGAARVEVLEVSDDPIYSATGDDFERLSAERLCQDMRSRNQHSYAFGSVEAIIEDILREYKEGDVVLVMSNGDFDNIHERLLTALRELPAA